jgi:cysteine synthase A
VGEVLKEKNPDLKIVAVEPEGSSILSGGKPGWHDIQGLGAGFIPSVLNRSIYDEVITVTNEQAAETARGLARQEGILAGPASGANVFALLQLARRPEHRGQVLLTVICDTGERYMSTPLFQQGN